MSENPISFVPDPNKGVVYLSKHAILAGMSPFVGFVHSVTVVLDRNTKAWNPEGGWFNGPDTVSYIQNTHTGSLKARVGAELFE